jgi:hypothetical protein
MRSMRWDLFVQDVLLKYIFRDRDRDREVFVASQGLAASYPSLGDFHILSSHDRDRDRA